MTSAPSSNVGAQQAKVDVAARSLVVVVARADMHVAAQSAALAADHERDLRVSLEAHHTVCDVGAGALKRARPDDVRCLVEASLELDQDDDLLAGFGRLDERADDR